ncbi:MAG: DUF192 domain-containing protein [Sphingomicrobium sp.]
MDSPPRLLDQVPLTIQSGDATHRFMVEVARSPEDQEVGLMNRAALADDCGMIFPYDPPRQVAFWMKDTLIPLDMIFVAPDRRILAIGANAVPLSLDPVPSGGTVLAVLEIKGGWAAMLGIKPGDRVDWKR